MHSICSRCNPTSCNAASIMVSGLLDRPGEASTISLAVSTLPSAFVFTTATRRCGEENSSPRIFIRDPPFRFIDYFNAHKSEIRPTASHIGCWMLDVGCWMLNIKPSFRPFNYRHSVRLQVILQSRADDLRARLQSVQIQMK